MFCAKCGKEIDNDSTFCLYCGQKVGAPVENREIVNSSNPVAFSVKKFTPIIAVVIVGLLAIVGITKLVGGSDKESVSAESNEAVPETNTMDTAEAVETDMITDSGSEADNDGILTVYTWDFEKNLENFFDLQSEIIGKGRIRGTANQDSCNTLDTLLEYSGGIPILNMKFYLDERLKIPEDYDTEAFKSGMRESARVIANEFNDFKRQYNRPAEYYDLKVDITDSNIGNMDFKYYPGTDAVVYVKCQFRFLCLNSAQYSIDLWNDCWCSTDIYASFVNSEYDGWLLSGLTTDESSVDLSNKLLSEDRDTTKVEADDSEVQDAINAYVETFNSYAENAYYTECALIYLDNDNIPELVVFEFDTYQDIARIWSYKNGAVIPCMYKYKDGWLVSSSSDDYDEKDLYMLEVREDDDSCSGYIERKGIILEKSFYTSVLSYNILRLTEEGFKYGMFATETDNFDELIEHNRHIGAFIEGASDIFTGTKGEIEAYIDSQGELISFMEMDKYLSVQDAYDNLAK